MKIIPNYITENTKVFAPSIHSQTFTSAQESSDTKPKGRVTLPVVTPDYNVNVPIAYKHIEDIKLNNDLTAKYYRLANGQKVVIVPKEGSTVVKTYVNTGSFNEPDNIRGISHYIEHNLFNGSETLGDKIFFDEVNKMGAETNASTSFSVTDYFIASNLLEDTDLENTIKLQAGQVQYPKFLLDKLDKEKKIVDAEINMYMSEDESVGFSQTIKNLFNIKSSSADLVAGTTDNIDSLTREDVLNYFKSNYYPANMVTVISGDVDPEETMKIVSKYFTAMNTPTEERKFEKMVPIEKTVRQDIISRKTKGEATVFLGFAGPENNNTKDKIYMEALAYLFGGLDNSRISAYERQYGTFVDIFPERLSSRPADKSLMMIQSSIPNAKVELLLKDIYSVVNDLSNNPPTEEELTAIKNRMKKSNNEMLERSDSINSMIGRAFLNGNVDRIKNFNSIIDNMTAEDIVNTAKKYLDLNKAALTVVHPSNTTKQSIEDDYKLISSISFTGSDKKIPIDINKVEKYRMPNNFEVVMNDINTDNVYYNFSLEKKIWTPQKAAVADVLSCMMNIAGTNTRSVEDLSKQSDILAMDSYTSVSPYGLNARADFTVDGAKDALNLLNDKIKNTDLSQENFDKAVALLRDEYLTSEPSPFYKLDKAIYEGTPLSFTPQDKLQSLNSITLEDVKAFYNDIFENGQAQVVVSAPFSKHPELKQTVFDSVGAYSKVQPRDVSLVQSYRPIDKVQVYTDTSMKNEAKIVEGFKFKHNGNLKDYLSVALLNEIMGGSASSRLFKDLRESRHLAYSVNSNCEYDDDIGVMSLYIGTTTENQESGKMTYENIQKSIDGFNENIQKITTEKVSPEELENAKKSLKSRILSISETNMGKNAGLSFANSTLYGLDYINKEMEMIDKITADDIYNAARYVFKEKPVYSIVATKASLEANKAYLESLEASN